jgi:hypothetical protein
MFEDWSVDLIRLSGACDITREIGGHLHPKMGIRTSEYLGPPPQEPLILHGKCNICEGQRRGSKFHTGTLILNQVVTFRQRTCADLRGFENIIERK